MPPNNPCPGDTEAVLLRKILNTLAESGGATSTVNLGDTQFSSLDFSLSSLDSSSASSDAHLANIDTATASIDGSIDVNLSTRASEATLALVKTNTDNLDVALSTVGQQRGSLTDGSGTITTGGTSQQIFAANAARKYLLVVNVSVLDLWINFGVAAVQTQPSIKIVPNGSFVMEGFFVSTETVNIIGATTGTIFTAKQA